MNWEELPEALKSWHDTKNRQKGHAAIEFLEQQLRFSFPSISQYRSEEFLEDALASFLKKVYESALIEKIESPKAYFKSSFRNHCIDKQRSDRRYKDRVIKAKAEYSRTDPKSPLDSLVEKERVDEISKALASLEIQDRVALKLQLAVYWLDFDEIVWLSRLTDPPRTNIRQLIRESRSTHDLTLILDPLKPKESSEDRRKRLDRFNKRFKRALKKLQNLLWRDE